jgi:hypothetical protein
MALVHNQELEPGPVLKVMRVEPEEIVRHNDNLPDSGMKKSLHGGAVEGGVALE